MTTAKTEVLRRNLVPSASTRHFARHYVEMIVAMFLGMLVLGAPALLALGAAGVSSADLHNDLPAVMLLGMGVTMTVPMVGWMATAAMAGSRPPRWQRPCSSRHSA